jgi:hypothetical protein
MRDYTPHKSGKDVHENRKHRSVNGYVLNRITINNASMHQSSISLFGQ